ncbi:aspartate dehydrogenase [Oceaniovalibus guishaninsula JLT2003]|uniref:L-aspartate dehydrogenase n=1 Tax=Oceaniovalibus guishaninsula JLT2003 TaxID=1231392 RepID=K2HBT7_9RHOB|nr:aspartate dehydrogenase [Oceaniovalibus guishaninsula JLT2003]
MIGRGAIASYVLDAIGGDAALNVVAQILRPGTREACPPGVDAVIATDDLGSLPVRPDLVVDCAGHDALRLFGAQALSAGIDLVSISVGALAESGLAETLEAAGRAGGGRLRLASGAIGAMDALAAAAVGGLDTVSYTGTKPPGGWRGSPAEEALDLGALTAPAVHFDGTAREAALRYPKNANVAAMIALAGIGMDATRVTLVADPAAKANVHEIEAAGAFGRMRFTVEGQALAGNPRSSALAAMSVVHAIRREAAPIAV